MKITKTVLIILSALLLVPLFFATPTLAQDNFETIYPEEESVENGKDVVQEEGSEEENQQEEELSSEDGISKEEDEEIIEETVIDEYTKTTKNRYFDLTLKRKDQTPFGKYVPYELTVTPHIDSPRTQILWNTPSTLESKPKHEEFVSLNSGETYIFKGRVKPLKAGVFDFSVSVISWQPDTNYTNSITDTIVFNNNLVLQPVSTHYQLLNALKFFLIALAFAGTIALVIIVVKKNVPKAKKWLTPPDW
jgi:hypothetical protein